MFIYRRVHKSETLFLCKRRQNQSFRIQKIEPALFLGQQHIQPHWWSDQLNSVVQNVRVSWIATRPLTDRFCLPIRCLFTCSDCSPFNNIIRRFPANIAYFRSILIVGNMASKLSQGVRSKEGLSLWQFMARLKVFLGGRCMELLPGRLKLTAPSEEQRIKLSSLRARKRKLNIYLQPFFLLFFLKKNFHIAKHSVVVQHLKSQQWHHDVFIGRGDVCFYELCMLR